MNTIVIIHTVIHYFLIHTPTPTVLMQTPINRAIQKYIHKNFKDVMPAGKLQIPKKIKELQAPTKILRDELKLKLSDRKHSMKAFNEAFTGVCFMVACAVSEQVAFDRHNISKVEHLANTNRNRSHPSNGPARTHVLRVHHRQK